MSDSISDSFARAAMCGQRDGTPLVRRERKPWKPREPIEILEFTEANDEVSGDDLSGGDADVSLLGPEMAEGGERK